MSLIACSSDPAARDDPGYDAGPPLTAVDIPVPGISEEWQAAFNAGDIAFSTPLREADGLGPLYSRASCDACHAEALRGPGGVEKMSVVLADRATPDPDQSRLGHGHTVRPLTTAGATTPILPPEGDPAVKVTLRVGPPVIGRGYVEAVLDSEIERVAAEQLARGGPVRGRVNHVKYGSTTSADARFHTLTAGSDAIGRFGLKARVPTLDDFTADAFQGDLGITSPLRPAELPNPDGLTDDDHPGVDVELGSVVSRATYLRLLAIPSRHLPAGGAELFASTGCAECHVPSLRTRADYPVEPLADIEAPLYSDLLLHDMGDDLADGLPTAPDLDGEAGSRDWRTPPLIGLRYFRTFLHDGRATSLEAAVLGHRGPGSEANDAVSRFLALSAESHRALLQFVEEL